MASGSDVWSVSSAGDAVRLFEAPNGSAIRAIDPSPDAQDVAILIEPGSGGQQTAQVLLVDAAGSVVERIDAPGASDATPVAEMLLAGKPLTGHRKGIGSWFSWEPGMSSRFPQIRRFANPARLRRGCRRRGRTGLVPNWAKCRIHL